jgi:hypothetical protein
MTVEPGHQTAGNVHVIWSLWIVLGAVTYFRKSLHWRRPMEAYNLECQVPTVKYREGSVMVWAYTAWYSILLV